MRRHLGQWLWPQGWLPWRVFRSVSCHITYLCGCWSWVASVLPPFPFRSVSSLLPSTSLTSSSESSMVINCSFYALFVCWMSPLLLLLFFLWTVFTHAILSSNEPPTSPISAWTGIGIGFVTGLLPVIISEYFGRRRTAATGLSYAGAGFGAFIFPLVFQSLLDSCGLQKSLLIMGGLIFNCTFGAILLIPPSSSYDMLPLCLSKRKEVTSNEAEIEGDCRTTLRQSSSPSPHSTQSLTASDETASGTGYTDDSTVGVVEDRHHQNDTNRKCRECRNDTGRFFHPIKHERSLGRKDDRREFALLNERSSLETSREEVVFSQHHEEQWNHHEEEQWIQGAKGEQKETGDEEKVPQNERRNQLQYSSPLPRHQDGKKEAKAVISMTSEAGEESRSKEIHELKEEVLPPRKLSSKIDTTHQGEHLKTKDSLLNRIHSQILTDAKILTHRHFFLINTTYVSYLMANVTFLMILPDFAVDAAKVSKSQGVLLISFFALSDIFGRLLPGWLPVSNKNLYAFSILSMGSLLLSCPLFLSLGTDLSTKYDTLILIAICCGFVSGCQMVLPPVVIADLMGRENTAVAFGLCNFVYGLCNFGRPFLFRKF